MIAAFLDLEQVFIDSPLYLLLNTFIDNISIHVLIFKLFHLLLSHCQLQIVMRDPLLQLLVLFMLEHFELLVLVFLLVCAFQTHLLHLGVILVMDGLSGLWSLNKHLALCPSKAKAHFLFNERGLVCFSDAVLAVPAHIVVRLDQVTPLVQHT